ncbi:acetyl-CoA carboxylase biotin carboxylase subunit family protein [Kitasatospora sp. NPDC058162]|uniref:ATP-grasp domain-containing protein n=1 Tax=Kitasatospora sp. NPDC058162 TaxID=3346362 RepID=UPI0036DF9849
MILHQWTDRFAEYESYVDHTADTVTYIAAPWSLGSIPGTATAVKEIASTEDEPLLRGAVADLVAEYGVPDRIIALNESDLDLAAVLREELGVPGQTPADLAPFRDKLVMAQRLAAAGVAVPATVHAVDHQVVRSFAEEHGWPVLLKPARGTSSIGVTRLDSADDLAAFVFPPDEFLLVQPYLPHEILHVDGVSLGDGLGLGAWRASRYVNTCFAYTEGKPLGSVEVDDPVLLSRLEDFTTRTTAALSADPVVFHLELFVSGPQEAPEVQFLEIGARPGGAEIPFLWREVHGIDLMKATFALQAGESVPAEARSMPPVDETERVGWLLVSTPEAKPCRVVSSELALAPEQGPYTTVRPVRGRTLVSTPGYEHGYENSGARFRFRGRSGAEVLAKLERTVAEFDFRCRPVDPNGPELVVLIGSGERAYREYAFKAISRVARIALVSTSEATWEREYVTAHRQVPDTTADSLVTAIGDLFAEHGGNVGVMTWAEVLLEDTAAAAERLGMRHMSPTAASNCRDKLSTRRLQTTGLVRFARVDSQEEALAAAEAFGFPVVVKPRSLAGSVGVAQAATREELVEHFAMTAASSFPGLTPLGGSIVEEFVDGPEISVDSVVFRGEVQPVNVARKRLGFEPYCQEVGHLVAPWRDEEWADQVTQMLTRTHHDLGITDGVTHAEVRLTASGPKLIELNGRLGGDFIPRLGFLATGIDLTAAAASIALGHRPDVTPQRDRCVEIRFLFPAEDGVVESVDTTAAEQLEGVVEVVRLIQPPTPLRLPPRGLEPRVLAVVVAAATPEECGSILDKAESLIEIRLTPFDSSAAGR